MKLPSADFESAASASSAIPAFVPLGSGWMESFQFRILRPAFAAVRHPLGAVCVLMPARSRLRASV